MSSVPEDANRVAILESVRQLPVEARALVADQIILEQQKEFANAQADHGLVVHDLLERDQFYAIHNDDLEMLKESALIAAAIYAGLPNPVTVIGGLMLILYRFKKKRILLTAHQALALHHVSDARTLGIDKNLLIEQLRRDLGRAADPDAVINALTAARRADGTASPLIELKDDRYYALDV